MKKFIITLLVLVIVGGAGAAAYYYKYGRAPEPEVSTVAVTRGDIIQTVGGTGTIQAVITVDVGTQVNGIIKELYADFNSMVHKGALIAKIDPATIEATIERDKANLDSAKANLDRLKVALDDSKNKLRRADDLYKRKLVTEQDLETAQVNEKTADTQIAAQLASIKQSEATLNQDNVNLGYTNIYAPIDGIIINRKVDIGQTVVSNNAATSMFQIAADLTEMQVQTNIDESDVGLIRPGQRTTFRVDAFPAKEFVGTVGQVRLQPVVQQNVVTYVVVINVPNPNFELKPGMTANVKVEIARREGVLRVPNAAIRFRPTEEIFAAFNQAVPPELLRGRGRGGLGGTRGQNAALGGGQPGAPGAPTQQAQAGGNARGQSADRGGGDRTGTQPADRQASFRRGQGGQSQSGQPGQGGGRGGFGPGGQNQNMTPEERQKMMVDRVAKMTPEERQQYMARVKERGGDPNNPATWTRGGGGGRGGQGGQSDQNRQGRQNQPPTQNAPTTNPLLANMTPLARALAGGGSNGMFAHAGSAATIDALFGPLPSVETRGRVWVYNATKDKKELKAINSLRLGITDSTFTELIEGALTENMLIVTSVDLGSKTGTPTRSSTTGNPLMPQGGRGGGMGGPGGGR